MSHVTTLKTNVRFKNLTVLREALVGLGEVSQTYSDYYGREYDCTVAIRTPDFQRGIGFVLEGGEYRAKVDSYGNEDTVNNLLKQIQQRYQAAAIKHVLKRQRYSNITTKTDGQGSIHILARRYA